MSITGNARGGNAVPRLIRCLAEANGRFSEAADLAKTLYPGQNNIAQTLRDYVAPMSDVSNPLAPSMQAEIFSWFRDSSLVGMLADRMRGVPFKVNVPVELESAATGAWLPRAGLTPARALTFSETSLNSYLAGFLIVLSAELAKLGGLKAEAEIRRILTAQMVRFIDHAFLDPDLAAVENVNPASVLNGATQFIPEASPATEYISEAYLCAMARRLETFGDPVWIMNPSGFAAYEIYKLISYVGGIPRMMGWPVVYTSACPDLIAIVDLDRIILADDGETTLEVSENATITMGDGGSPESEQIVSMFDNDMMALKVTRRISWALTNPGSAVYLLINFAE